MALADFAAFDTSVPLVPYQNLFENYINKIQTNVIDYLNNNFNFGRTEGSTEYHDFWIGLTGTSIIQRVSFADEFLKIKEYSQETNNNIGARYMDYVGMVTSLDSYMCFAGDAFSRICDTAWAFGDGSAYMYRTGELLPDGSFNIIRKGLRSHLEEINKILNEMELYTMTDTGTLDLNIPGMARVGYSDINYLTRRKEDYFIPKIMKINDEILAAKQEALKLVDLAYKNKEALNKWLPESFKLVAYTGLAFNLNKKNENLASKIISYSNILSGSVPPRNVVTTTSLIAVSQAKFWKEQVLPDFTNHSQCLTNAIIYGFAALGYPGMLEGFIDDTWEFMIPKYG